ncbi:annexin A6-like [Tubulanus polymorphus]|uniref:annexin A6-like n=1 Tax=Tubulanus polymorphus TaxID=672921 RepID=UPI003DA35BD3
MGCDNSKSALVSDKNAKPLRPKLGDCDLPKSFYADRLVVELHKAITDNKYQVIITIFYKYKDTDYEELAETFEHAFGVNLMDMAQSKLSPEMSTFVSMRINSRLRAIAFYLKQSLDTKDYTSVIEIICAYSELNLTSLQQEYSDIWAENLPDVLRNSHLDDEIRQILLSLLSKRAESQDEENDLVVVKQTIVELSDALQTNDLFENKMLFLGTCSSRSRIQLRDIFEGFVQKSGRDLTVELEKFYWEDREKCQTLTTLVDALRKKEYYFADKIKALLAKDHSESRQQLIFTILSRPEHVLRDVKNCYKKTCLENLTTDIEHAISDQATRLILVKHLAKC